MFDSVSISGLTAQLNTLNLIAAGPNDLWTTKWLTPIWFLGVGLAFGLLAIGLFILLTRVLSNVPVWEQLSRSVAGHVVAALLTAGISGSIFTTLSTPLKIAPNWFQLRN